jgi:hypothetical protein
MRTSRLRRWTSLALGLAAMGLAALTLSHGSRSAGSVITQGQERGLESGAYFYTEVDGVEAFLDDEGRYRRRSTRDE